MSKNYEYDYSDFENSWAFLGPALTKAQRAELVSVINPEICEAHGISMQEKHEELLFSLVRIMKTGSAVSFVDGEIVPPKDQPTIKSARKDLADAAKYLRKAQDKLHGLPNDQTAFALLKRIENFEDIGAHLPAIAKTAEILESAASFKGKRGAQPNPDWVAKFCQECQEFWAENMTGGSTLVYQNEQQSPVSEWVFALYVNVGEFTGVRPKESMLYSYAKRPNR